MKWIGVIAVGAALVAYAQDRRGKDGLPVGIGEGEHVRIDLREVSAASLAELHEPGLGPTIVELTLVGCKACARFEAKVARLRDSRPDLSFVQVVVPNRGSGPEGQRMMEQLDAFGLCGFPHVAVLADDGSVVATDRCFRKDDESRDGLDYMNAWFDQSS